MKIGASLGFLCVVFLTFRAESKPLDSLRTETINGKKFIIHRIDKGQGLYAIARRYNIDVQKIIDVNPGKTDKINKGDLIRIPLISSDSAMQREEAKEGINPKPGEKIRSSNKPNAEKLIPDSSIKNHEITALDEVHANADSRENEKIKIHVVVPGDNVSKISQKYKITPQLLYKWNGLKSNKLEVGQELIVDGSLVIKPYEKWNAPNSVSTKAVSPQNILSNAEVIEETGFADIGGDHTILHKTAPPGTLILVTNLDNSNQCYVKVTGKIEKKGNDEILVMDNATKQKLNAESNKIRIRIKYVFSSPAP